jgi:hypothetical protein
MLFYLAIPFYVSPIGIWIFTLVNCISRDSSSFYPVFSTPDLTNLFWLVIVIGFGPVGVIIYWEMNRDRKESHVERLARKLNVG